jgi:preprotein translocase subunit SecG
LITALSVLDVIVSIALIGSVLMQSGKGSGLSDAFGGGGYFGKGNDMDTMMAKATIVLGILFAVITLVIAKLSM